ncbi:phosphoglycerate kinase [Candidatus Woesearchaeota archaeon]|nr:phosphoglycerate kinase [Candidatus Woesearchaeota archaeon]
MIFSLTEFPLRNKTVLVRVDYNVPLKNNKVTDNTKIKASLLTLRYLLQKECQIVLATHLGRPQGKVVSKLTTTPLIKELKKLLPKKTKITKLSDCVGEKIKKRITKGKSKEIFMLENLRFHKEEKANSSAFAYSLASLADFYINDAFAVSHRQHASVDAITKFIPAAQGFLLRKEINHLSKVLKPKKPLVWIIGGIKKDKLTTIKQLAKKADHILIGSGFVNLIKKSTKKIILPLDLNQEKDIGPKTITLFQSHLKKAKTIVWNGPLGQFEKPPFAVGSKKIARFISRLKATTIIGGGETSEMIHQFKLAHKMTWVSTGGGASLSFLTGKKLSAIKALEKNYKKFKKKIT